jgi:hypothetical protein
MDTLREARVRYGRRLRNSLTPSERMARFVQLQNLCMQQVKATPDGWRAFLRRNLRKRAINPGPHDR